MLVLSCPSAHDPNVATRPSETNPFIVELRSRLKGAPSAMNLLIK